MLSTFNRLAPMPEPRNRLLPGVTEHYSTPLPIRATRAAAQAPEASAPAPTPVEVPDNPADFALQSLHFPADPHQQEILAAPGPRVALCCSRQFGKSTLGAAKAVHHALTHPGALILIASRTLRQAGELLEKAIGFARTLGLPIRRAPRHRDSLLLPNQSRLIALPGRASALRGFSAVSLLIIDEAAYVEDDLYFALRPMLATSGGALWLLSTARHRTGFFYEEFVSEGDT